MYTIKLIVGDGIRDMPKDMVSPKTLNKYNFRLSKFFFEHVVFSNRLRKMLYFVIIAGVFLLLSLSTRSSETSKELLLICYEIISIIAVFAMVYLGDVGISNKLLHSINSSRRFFALENDSFEWDPTSVLILREILFQGPISMSVGEAAKIAGVKRSTAKQKLSKMEKNGLIYKDLENKYHFGGVSFEVYSRERKQILKDEKLTKDAQDRLNYLLKLLCFTYG